MQSFSPRLITCGASGYLRQEFRELELLDEITKLRYEGQLPDHIQGNFRNPLIRAYQTWKGTNYVPDLTHPALKWSSKDPLPLLPVVTDAPWQIIEKKWANKKKKKTGDTEVEDDAPEVQSGFVAAEGSVPINSSKKRRVEDEENGSESTKKTKTAQMIMASADSSSPSGLIWDGENYSCAYNALFTVLFESGLLTQGFGQEDSRKLINTISSHCLPVSKNILMDIPVLKLPEILSGMSCIHKILQNFPMAPEAQVLLL